MPRGRDESTKVGAPIVWCVLAAALFGASTPASKALLQYVSPFTLSGFLYLGAALFVAPSAVFVKWPSPLRRRAQWLPLLGAVVFGGAVGPVLLLTGLLMAPAGSVALWLSLETVATVLLARVFFREHVGPRAALAVASIVLGSALLAPSAESSWKAIACVAFACFAWGFDNNLTSIIDRFTPAQVTFAKGTMAGSVNIVIGFAVQSSAPSAETMAITLGIGAICYGLSLVLYVTGAQHLGAVRSQLLFSTAPVWGLALSWTALGEPVLGVQIGASVLMAFGLWTWYRERHSHRHTHLPTTHTHRHRHDDGHHQHWHGEPVAPHTWHSHEHSHEAMTHEHPHRPDLHHRHEH